MRLAVLSDVHANLAALEAVCEVLDRERYDRILCTGDLVGYNAEPIGTVRLVRAIATFTVAGNHDRELSTAPSDGTSPSTRASRKFTRDVLDPDDLVWIANLPPIVREPPWVAVHGCYLNTSYLSGYVTDTMLDANLVAIDNRDDLPKIAFCGHTHVSTFATRTRGVTSCERAAGTVRWSERAEVVLVNAGSVGQPRDRDPRASFAIVDLEERTATFHRVAYDVERAIRAIADAGLDPALGERLREGR